MLASDINNPEFIGAANPDSALSVRFHTEPIKNEYKSNLEGRPIFEDVLFVEIHTPGNNLNVIDTPAREYHKQRFPLHWAHFKNTNDSSGDNIGTPIEHWSFLTKSQVEELRALKFKKVDSIANASDQQIASIGMLAGISPHAFREKARNFLRMAKDDAVVQKQADEIQKLRDEQTKKEAYYASEMAELKIKLEQLMEKKKDKPKLWGG